VDGFFCRIADERWSLKVGLADAERKNAVPLLTQLGGASGHRERGAGSHGGETCCRLGAHGGAQASAPSGVRLPHRYAFFPLSSGFTSIDLGASGGLESSFKPFLKFLIPSPNPLPMSDSLPAPNKSRAMSAMRSNSPPPIRPIMTSLGFGRAH